ncbi:histone deacetylase [Aggregicoccus sp. 17bor-14]|uniref:histone deacetylase family protein n=1 Tax=Myxococcaceae TaxID=31 RepID=UPI00129C7A69|nr:MULTISPECIES: histone deacetylase [Myxococcaceae]MBF5043627.1 histone deacetylase [Simulacricoccus sp. 17bor-14]MRI89386.1 histone deacetylase [Aggregicoccus sp. 17bor-14]
MHVFSCDGYEVPLPEGHRFPMGKYRLLRERLLARGVLRPGELHPSEPVAREVLARVHTPGYLDALFEGRLSEAELRRLGFPWSEALLLRSRASVGGTLAAARAALQEGVAGNLAGGTHHAFPGHGEGYCVFNDIAVAIRALQAEGALERAVVVDLDVHQGNGTAAVFEGDARVFTFSMHGEHNFPFRKQRSSRDVGLPDGTGDADYLEALARHLPEVLEAAGAELLFYQAGVDALAEDALGRLSLSHAGLRERDRSVLEAAWHRGLPVVLTLGGGYAKPLDATLEAHVGTYEVARERYG